MINNTFLVINTETMIAKRFVDGKYTGDFVRLDDETYTNKAAYQHAINNFRLNGW